MRKIILLSILLLGFLLRFYRIETYPAGFTQDEAAIGYEAYSILKTGKDSWGQPIPLVLRSFGDYKMPLYSYLDIPFIASLGLSEMAVRLPAVIMGSLSVLFTYLMVNKMSNKKELGLLSAFILSVSPWHIQLSRGAFEANLSSLFLPMAVWAFLKAKENKSYMAVSALAFGLNMFSYHSARLFTPIIVLAVFLIFYKDKRQNLMGSVGQFVIKYKLSSLMLLVFSMVALYGMLFSNAARRGADVTILNPTGGFSQVADKRWEARLQGMPDFMARMFSNKLVFIGNRFIENYLSYLSPDFLFNNGPGEWTYGMISGSGVLYFIDAVFLLAAAILFIRDPKNKLLRFMVIWVILAPLPAVISKSIGNAANRSAIMMPAIQILSSYGLFVLYKKFGMKILYASMFLTLLSLSFFLEDYYFHAPKQAAQFMGYGRKQMVSYINEVEDQYDTVQISRTISVPHIWLLFYNRVDPALVQKKADQWISFEEQGLVSIDQLDHYELGKYKFGNLKYEDSSDKVLYIGKQEDFNGRNVEIRHEIPLPNGAPYIIAATQK